MDINTIAQTALTIALPFLNKTSEGFFEKVGEDVWSLIKKPFQGEKENEIIYQFENDPNNIEKKEILQRNLIKALEQDENLLKAINEFIKTYNESNTNNRQINQYGQKPVYIERLDGGLTIN